MIRIFKTTPNIDFIKPAKYLYLISAIVILAGVVSVIIHGGFNMSIEFVGGTFVQLRFEKPVDNELGTIRTAVTALGLGSPEIKTIANPGSDNNNEIQIIVKKQAEGLVVADEIKAAVAKAMPDNHFEMRRQEKVGPKIGAEMMRNAFLAVFLSLIGICLYIWIRFNLPYGVGGVAGLFHDVMITLTVFSFLGKEISVGIIAALLTIVGYSINDTVVVFDRVRENLGGKLHLGGGHKNLAEVMNRSINQTLSRTIITTSTVLFVLFAFTMFGGEVIRDFSLAMLIGCFCGAYSTVFICAPVVLQWYKKWPAKHS
jgi:preprotein translocase subunit SecF